MRCDMSNIMYSIFSNKKVNLSKLLQFGFVQTESGYIYRKTLSESGFLLNVHVTPQGEISTEIIDPSLNELYTLHLVGHATGGFVETVKYEYQETLLEIATQCFQTDIFQSKQSNELIDYVRKTYGDEKVSEKCNLAEEGYAKMVRYIIDGIKAKIGTSGR